MSEALPLPQRLRALIAAGAWPRTEAEAARQSRGGGPISDELVQRLVPGEHRVYFCSPPFRSVAQLLESGERRFWDECGDLDSIDAARTLLIGDFGLGSDTAIALDYRYPEPALIRLKWDRGSRAPRWAPFFSDFADFAAAFGIEGRRWR